jgi:hypothetical protein
VIVGLTVAAFAVPASVAHGQGPGTCFLPPGNAQSNVAKAPGNPNVFWQEGFGFRNLGDAVHMFCGVGQQP